MPDFILPAELYMPRKSFEFGASILLAPKIEELTSYLLSQINLERKTASAIALERFWAREHACYLEFCRNKGKRYSEYLPGREYTYHLLTNLILKATGGSVITVLEAGCGSGLTCSLLAVAGATTVGIDIAVSGLRFAQAIAREYSVEIKTVEASWVNIPFAQNTFDVVFSLGALEHHPIETQRLFFSELVRVTRNLVIILVPNTNSPIYKTMEEKEFITMPVDLVYPEEHQLYHVDLMRLCISSGLVLFDKAALHVVPPKVIPERHLTSESYEFFSEISLKAMRNWDGSALSTWLSVESQCSHEQKDKFGWFSYVVAKKKNE